MLLDNRKKKLFDEAYDAYREINKDIEDLCYEALVNPFAESPLSVTDAVCSLDLFLQGTMLKIGVIDGVLTDQEIEFILSLPDELNEVCVRNRGYKRFLKSISVENYRINASKYYKDNDYPLFLKMIYEKDNVSFNSVINSIEKILNAFVAIDDKVSKYESDMVTQVISSLRSDSLFQKKTPPIPIRRDETIAIGEITGASESLQQVLEELDSLVGLSSVKQDVLSTINLLKVNNMRKDKGLPELETSLHMVFTGQPGTGKTTVARIIAKIYKSMGVVSKGQLVETDRSGMVAGYVGQTALKTAQVIKKAKGGVLFIDEAYSLNSAEGSNDFGKEAIDTLVKGMEDYRDDLVVIVAGYTDEMKNFIKMNPGLKSRFNKYINFANYSSTELLDIFKGLCSKAQFILAPEAEVRALHYFEHHQGNKDFGNARGVRNFFDRTVTAQATRILALDNLTEEEFRTIQAEDLV